MAGSSSRYLTSIEIFLHSWRARISQIERAPRDVDQTPCGSLEPAYRLLIGKCPGRGFNNLAPSSRPLKSCTQAASKPLFNIGFGKSWAPRNAPDHGYQRRWCSRSGLERDARQQVRA